MPATAANPRDDQLELWAKSVFLGASLGEIVDLNQPAASTNGCTR